MTTQKELQEYLGRLYGASGVIVRDPGSSTGFREWNGKDTRDLCDWLEDRGRRSGESPQQICHNLAETAAITGVGIHTVQAWLRRSEHFLPHFRDGRRIIVPHDLLVQWTEEEAGRRQQDG